MAETAEVNGKFPSNQAAFNNFADSSLDPIWESLHGTQGGGYMFGGLKPGFWNDGAHVVALFNTGRSGNSTVSVDWSQVGFSGSRLWRIPVNGDSESVGTPTAYYVGTYGRLRTVTRVPGADQLWLSTTNCDNNGGAADGSDRIFRVTIN